MLILRFDRIECRKLFSAPDKIDGNANANLCCSVAGNGLAVDTPSKSSIALPKLLLSAQTTGVTPVV
ncbi:hypothetical protein PAENIP36_49710 [Paenibacillus sp. P36]